MFMLSFMLLMFEPGDKIPHLWYLVSFSVNHVTQLTLKVPIATKVVCFSSLLKCLQSLYDKQCEP